MPEKESLIVIKEKKHLKTILEGLFFQVVGPLLCQIFSFLYCV